MNKELKLSIIDLCIGYACATAIMYFVSGTAYYVGKQHGKTEITDKLKTLVHEHATRVANEDA